MANRISTRIAIARRVAERKIDEDTPIDGFEEFQKVLPTKAVQMDEAFEVDTLEGKMKGKAGDWLAEGPEGERYPIDQAIFDKTYKPVKGKTAGFLEDERAKQSAKIVAMHPKAGQFANLLDWFGDVWAEIEHYFPPSDTGSGSMTIYDARRKHGTQYVFLADVRRVAPRPPAGARIVHTRDGQFGGREGRPISEMKTASGKKAWRRSFPPRRRPNQPEFHVTYEDRAHSDVDVLCDQCGKLVEAGTGTRRNDRHGLSGIVCDACAKLPGFQLQFS